MKVQDWELGQGARVVEQKQAEQEPVAGVVGKRCMPSRGARCSLG